MKKYLIGTLIIACAYFGYYSCAQADVCFLPEGEGCNQVPYNEGDGGNEQGNVQCNVADYCYATEAEAKAQRGEIVRSGMDGKTTVLDSYSLNNGCYCLKKSCSLSTGSEAVINPETLYSDNPGGNWSCTQCNDSNSNLHGKCKCSCNIASRQGYYVDSGTCELKAETCAAQTSATCEAQDVCHTCKGTGQYSGESECQRVVDVEPSCPQGYSKTVPSSLCYDTVDMTCGNEGDKCYQTMNEPNCGANKRVSSANGVCSCTCATGYHPDGDECVKLIEYTCPSGTVKLPKGNTEAFNSWCNNGCKSTSVPGHNSNWKCMTVASAGPDYLCYECQAPSGGSSSGNPCQGCTDDCVHCSNGCSSLDDAMNHYFSMTNGQYPNATCSSLGDGYYCCNRGFY